ncbi:peptidase inhibitor family I36 protein [Streptomyces sp. NPDC058751]|uniref:peptidase inhibitor family I36 protein n=1 Tax=Streptomyces sp. NPDC058751 TaxID=3346623 RepID=UPI0036B93CEE
MNWKRLFSTAAATVTLVGGGMLATAAPAQADGNCPSNAACLWDATGFHGQRILTRSTNTCFAMGQFNFGDIRSYDNNLSVDGHLWSFDDNGEWGHHRTFVAGGFSSNIGVPGLGGQDPAWICMGSANIYDYI